MGKKLIRENYSVWSYKFENFVHGKGLWDYITGDKACPKLEKEPGTENEEADNQWKEEVAAY